MITSICRRIRLLSAVIIVLLHCAQSALANPCDFTQVPFCTWTGSNQGFIALGDTGSIIDFESLPNGTPSYGGAPITPAFNYALLGATLGSPFPGLWIGGNSQIGYALDAYTSNPVAHNWITAALTQTEQGVGVTVIGRVTLFAYDEQDNLITSVSFIQHAAPYFLGIRSSIPIARAVIDNNSNSISLDDFIMIHYPVPEPASVLLLLVAPLLLRRRRP